MTTITANDDESFLYLFDRPSEPIVVPKGDKHVIYDIPDDYLVSFIFWNIL